MYLDQDISYVINKLKYNNYKCFIVGGYIRNYLINQDSDDYDLATNATPNDIIRIFKLETLITQYQKYGHIRIIINNKEIQITTLRIEESYMRNKVKIEYTNSQELDSIRRDFTINAMYYDIKGIIYDYHDGLNDLKNHKLNTIIEPNSSFKKDPIRIIRAIRFISEYNFIVNETLKLAIINNSHLLMKMSIKYLDKEINKILNSKYFKELDKEYLLIIERVLKKGNKNNEKN